MQPEIPIKEFVIRVEHDSKFMIKANQDEQIGNPCFNMVYTAEINSRDCKSRKAGLKLIQQHHAIPDLQSGIPIKGFVILIDYDSESMIKASHEEQKLISTFPI